MKRTSLCLALAALAAMGLSLTRPAAAQIGFKFQTLDVPFPGASGTQCLSINNQGVIVGVYFAAGGKNIPGFIFRDGAWSSVVVPGAGGAKHPVLGNLLCGFFGINDAGVTVGDYTDSHDVGHSFLRSADGTITFLADVTSATYSDPDDWTVAWGINNEGAIVGYFGRNPLLYAGHSGFILRHGVITIVDYPGTTDTELFGINDHDLIVGQWFDAAGSSHGLLMDHGVFTSFDPPGSTFTYPQGLNNNGDIVGSYADANGISHGFLLRKGVYYTFDFPGAWDTVPEAINDHGQIVGSYNNYSHGFIATIVEGH